MKKPDAMSIVGKFIDLVNDHIKVEFPEPGDFRLDVENLNVSKLGNIELLLLADFYGENRMYFLEYDQASEASTMIEYREHSRYEFK